MNHQITTGATGSKMSQVTLITLSTYAIAPRVKQAAGRAAGSALTPLDKSEV
jgi:hypothetical protein